MNALKSILLHLDDSARLGQRLEVAAQLARTFDADVTALYAVSSFYPAYPFAAPSTPEAAAALAEIEDANRAAAKAVFDAAVRGGAERMRWASVAVAAERAFARQARYADLMLLGQHEPGKQGERSLPPDFAQWVLIESGRPALIIPYIGAPAAIGRIAVVAWKNTREAAHAVGASLPLLRRCERVHVASWAEDEDDETSGPLDIEQYLRMHGVACTMHRSTARPFVVGEALLSLVSDVSADLLVMGCYGHSRAREWVLGGVTRSVLESMTVPVLMSH
jgi:nucleotide-binding universal stress UspA family protein